MPGGGIERGRRARPATAGVRGGVGDAPARRRTPAALIDALFPRDTETRDTRGPLVDLQSLLAESLRDLVRRTASDHACAWVDVGDGRVLALAGYRKAGEAAAPDPETFAALRRLTRPTDLGEPGIDPQLARLARDHALSAAAPFDSDGGREDGAMGILLAGGPDDRPGRVRPRTLATLGELAERLGRPLATAGAAGRLAELDAGIRRLDRLAALGDLAADIVHEVRNPLVSVKTFLQLLPDRIDDPEFRDDFRLVVCDEVARLERLLDSVLRHGQPARDAAPRGASDVAATFESLLQLVGYRARERGIALATRIGRNVANAAIASDGLRQLLLNLLLNAIDVSESGGTITLSADVVAQASGRFVRIGVADEGPGVPEAERERIFEPFHSSRSERPGGLGLSISRRLVEEAGGTIRLADDIARGARFDVCLPAAPHDDRA